MAINKSVSRTGSNRPQLNHGEVAGLKELGVTSKSLDVMKKIVGRGEVIRNLDDLIRAGIPAGEAAVIAENANFGSGPKADPKTIVLKIDARDKRVGTVLVLSRFVQGQVENVPVLISAASDPVFTFNEEVNTPFTLTAKSPSGDPLKVGTAANALNTNLVIKPDALASTVIHVEVHAEVGPGSTITPPLQRMKGKVISTGSDLNVGAIQIVIQVAEAASPADKDFFSVAFAETESSGYFTTSPILWNLVKDPAKLSGARAVMSVKKGVVIPIALSNGSLPTRTILSIDMDKKAGEEDDCACHDDCSQLNFYQKKALDEFSYHSVVRTSEPLIESYEVGTIDEVELDEVKDYFPKQWQSQLAGLKLNRSKLKQITARSGAFDDNLASAIIQSAKKEQFDQRVDSRFARSGGRVDIGIGVEVDWDEKPTIYQAVTVAHGHLLHFKQEWFSDGYSIGDLLYSLPLAPGQKKNIVVFDWDRKESASNSQRLDYQESLYHSLSRDRDINEVASATLRENSFGTSTANTSAFGGGIGIGAIIPIKVPIGILGGVAGGSATASSVASQASSRSTTANSQQSLSDRTQQASNMVRSQRSTVIQTVSQGERFESSSETIANYNHCHAMTVQYFEVLRHLQVRTRLAQVQECLFVPLKLSPFTAEKALRWRGTLVQYLKTPQLRRAFDALARVERERESPTENYYASIGIPSGSFAEERLEMFEGELTIEFQIIRPYNQDEAVEPPNWFRFARFVGAYNDLWRLHLSTAANRDETFARHVGPHVARAVCDHLQITAVRNGPTYQEVALPTDATLMSTFRHRDPLHISIRMGDVFTNGVTRKDIDFIKISLDESGLIASGLNDLMQDRSLRMIVHSGSLRYRTKNLHEFLFNSRAIRNDLTVAGDSVRIFTPLSSQAMRRPREEDVELSNELLHHLNENIEYYHQCIWTEMDAQRRYMLLDGIIAPGRSNGKSVASVVENRLIGIAGNCLIMPVSPGNNLDPSFDESIDLYEHYYSEPLDPISISLPTKGVYAEAVMGKCNSCEFKDEQRFWRWEESPIPDSPTSFNPMTVPTPTRATPDVSIKDFPNNVINIQSPPSAPDPQGFGALMTLLGKSDSFRDLTGLSENQKNALESLKQAFSTAEKFGEGAKELTGKAAELNKFNTQQAAEANRFNQYREMLKDGQIGKDDFKELVKDMGRSGPLKEVKEINEAEKKEEIDSKSAKRLKEAALKNAESESSSHSNSPASDPKLKGAVDSFSEAPVGQLTVTTPEGSMSLTKGGLAGTDGNVRLASDVRRIDTFCGVQGKTVVPIQDVNDNVVAWANDEHSSWQSSAGPRNESAAEVFGYLVSYWISYNSSIAPEHAALLREGCIDGSVAFGTLHSSTATAASVTTDTAAATQALVAKVANAPSNLASKIRTAVTNARTSATDHATVAFWSAVFISSMVRHAAMELDIEYTSDTGVHEGRNKLLLYSMRHSEFTREAYDRKVNGVTGCYHAFDPATHVVKPGDIIVQDRQATTTANVLDYTDVSTLAQRAMHTDIVVEIDDSGPSAITIGGNVGDSCKRRRFPLQANGTLERAAGLSYTQESNGGDLPAVAAASGNALGDNGTLRVFAVLSLVKECVDVPSARNDTLLA